MLRAARFLLSSCLLVGMALGSLPDPAVAAAADTAVPVRVGSYNIRSAVGLNDFTRAFSAFRPRIDVAGLQEIGLNAKNTYLKSQSGWGYYRPPQLQQNPVVWDTGVFTEVGAYGIKLADAADLGREKSGHDEFHKADFATVVHLRHRATGQLVSVVNVHLLSGAMSAGRPRPDRPLRVAFYKEQVRNLATALEDEKRFGQVFVLGDFNIGYAADARWQRRGLPYKRLTRHGLQAMWRTCGTDGRGTHGPQYIDQVWSQQPADSCDVAYDITQSDHYPVIGHYSLAPATGSAG
jgi:exonuclease III